MTTDTEALVRRAYHFAEGNVLDARGFIDLFAEDGVFNGIGGVSGPESYRVSNWAMWSSLWASSFPTFTGSCTGSTCSGTSSRSSCRSGHLPRAVRDARWRDPADGAKLDIPTADFWYVRDGKTQEFNCHIGVTNMFAQLGVLPDFTSVVAASAPER